MTIFVVKVFLDFNNEVTKLDNEIFNKAINAYVADPKKNLANLSKYAKDIGVYTKLMNVMEVLLNG